MNKVIKIGFLSILLAAAVCCPISAVFAQQAQEQAQAQAEPTTVQSQMSGVELTTLSGWQQFEHAIPGCESFHFVKFFANDPKQETIIKLTLMITDLREELKAGNKPIPQTPEEIKAFDAKYLNDFSENNGKKLKEGQEQYLVPLGDKTYMMLLSPGQPNSITNFVYISNCYMFNYVVVSPNDKLITDEKLKAEVTALEKESSEIIAAVKYPEIGAAPEEETAEGEEEAAEGEEEAAEGEEEAAEGEEEYAEGEEEGAEDGAGDDFGEEGEEEEYVEE